MILGKTDHEGEPGIEEVGFEGFELYVKLDDDLGIPPKTKNIFVIHQPKLVKAKGFYLPFDLADNSIEGHFSEKALERTVQYALRVGASRVVSHGGFVDRTVSDLEQGQEIVARRINRIHHPEVLILLENNPLWSTQMWINEPVLIDVKDFKNTLRQIEVPIGVCVDIEHLYRAAIFTSFYHKFDSEFRDLQDEEDYDELVSLIDGQFSDFVSHPPNRIDSIIKKFVDDFFRELKPFIRQIHVCGFDYLTDRTHVRGQVLPGAHLPLNYSGLSGGVEVCDRIDHKHYLRHLKGIDADVVVEVNNRPDYDYLKELKKSLEYLKGVLE